MRKSISMLLSAVIFAALAMTSTSFATEAASDPMPTLYDFSVPKFSDVPEDHPNYVAIMDLRQKGIIDGYPDGSFKPDQTVNRVEALKILLLGAQMSVAENVSGLPFHDTSPFEWYAPFLLKAFDEGIVDGYPDGSFKPDQTVNLVEALKMLLETNNVNMDDFDFPLDEFGQTFDPYVDASVSEWYGKYIWYARVANLIDRDRDGKVYPAEGLTRGKMAEMMYRLLWIFEENETRALFDMGPLLSYRKEVLLHNLDVDNGSDRFDFEADWDDLTWPSNEIWLGSLAINGSWTRDVDWNVVDMTKKYEEAGLGEASMEDVFDFYTACPSNSDAYSTIYDDDGDGSGTPRSPYSGGVFCVLTSEGNYAKVEVIDVWGENFGDDKFFKFRYIYRADGSPLIP